MFKGQIWKDTLNDIILTKYVLYIIRGGLLIFYSSCFACLSLQSKQQL